MRFAGSFLKLHLLNVAIEGMIWVAIKANLEIPLFIKVNRVDNTAIIVNAGGLKEGIEFSCGLVLTEFIPQGHKVALTDIDPNEEIVRYGEVIGYAQQSYQKEVLDSGDVGHYADCPLTGFPSNFHESSRSSQPFEREYTFLGYRNSDGSVGTKNILGISTSVQCVAGVLDFAVKKIKQELLPSFPNVDDVIALTHNYGCGVAINAPDAVIPIRTIQNLAKHPNFGGEVMIIGLGCEKLVPSRD